MSSTLPDMPVHDPFVYADVVTALGLTRPR